MNAKRKLLTLCLLAALGSAAEAEDVRHTLLFQEGTTAAQQTQYLDYWAGAGVSVVMPLPLINGVVVRVPDHIATTELAADPVVASVEADQVVAVQAVVASGEGGAGEGGAISYITSVNRLNGSQRPWGVLQLYDQPYDPAAIASKLRPSSVSDLIYQATNYAGQIKVALLDTGIDITHQVGYLVQDGIDLVATYPSPTIPMDDNGHGTHIAGTLALWDFGVAPGVQLYAAKILDSKGAGTVSSLAMGLAWAVDNAIDVVNMSVGFRDDSPAVRRAAQQAQAAGVVLVAAAGNHANWTDGGAGEGGAGEGGAGEGGAGEGGAGEGGAGEGGATDDCTDTTATGEGGAGEGGAGEGGAGEGGAGDDCTTSDSYGVMYPAAYPEVIAVAAMDPYLQLASFSNTGPEVDLLAPGVDVVSLDLNYAYGTASGTSMAAPHVAGAVALMQALALSENKTLTPTQIHQLLLDTANDGVIDLVAALEAVHNLP